MEIFKKVPLIMKEIGPLAKDRKNTQQGYSFRGIDDLMNAFAPVAAKHGVFPVCTSIESIVNEPVTSKSGGQGWRQKSRYHFAFYAEDGSNVGTWAEGEAIDYGDKGSNKAYSVAYREAIFKMFVIPFENEDIENHDHEITPSQSPKTAPGTTKRSQADRDAELRGRIKTHLVELGYKDDEMMTLGQVSQLVAKEVEKDMSSDTLIEIARALADKVAKK